MRDTVFESRIQCDCIAPTATAAIALGEAVRALEQRPVDRDPDLIDNYGDGISFTDASDDARISCRSRIFHNSSVTHMRLTQRVAPDDLPVTQQEILKHLRITNTESARRRRYHAHRRGLHPRTGRSHRKAASRPDAAGMVALAGLLPPCIRVPLPPLIKVCEINYLDTENAWQTLAEEKYRKSLLAVRIAAK